MSVYQQLTKQAVLIDWYSVFMYCVKSEQSPYYDTLKISMGTPFWVIPIFQNYLVSHIDNGVIIFIELG